MDTPAYQVPRNVLLLLLVVWCLRCNNQKEGETKDPPSESARGGFESGKKMKSQGGAVWNSCYNSPNGCSHLNILPFFSLNEGGCSGRFFRGNFPEHFEVGGVKHFLGKKKGFLREMFPENFPLPKFPQEIWARILPGE